MCGTHNWIKNQVYTSVSKWWRVHFVHVYAFQKWLLNRVGGKSLLLRVPLFSLLGYTSYRDTERGSWFIQEFVDVFYEHADEEHVMDMLTEVRTYQSSQYLDCKIGDCFQKRFVFAIYRYRCKKKKLEHISYSCNKLSWYYIILLSKMFT